MKQNGAPENPSQNPRRARRQPACVNDIDLSRWKEYDDIFTDSLWLIPERDRSGAHASDYHGNFVPQIPNQAMKRYTQKGELVLDLFLGSGTTLIECRRLGRNGIGVELQENIANAAKERIDEEENIHDVKTVVLKADSSDCDGTTGLIRQSLKEMGFQNAHLVILHPPYHSIIAFSDDPEDLSNCLGVDQFLDGFGRVVDVAACVLEKSRYLALVIGDCYIAGEWVPLGFYCMQRVMQRGFSLKSIVVKDIHNTRAKRNMNNIWRYRSLAGGYYVFKHEYVMFFRLIHTVGSG